jgi:hypothetical protein
VIICDQCSTVFAVEHSFPRVLVAVGLLEHRGKSFRQRQHDELAEDRGDHPHRIALLAKRVDIDLVLRIRGDRDACQSDEQCNQPDHGASPFTHR